MGRWKNLAGDGCLIDFEGHMLGRMAGAVFPFQEKAAVAEGNGVLDVNAEPGEHCVDPLGRAFELGPDPDGGLVEHEMTAVDGPFGAVFFVAEDGNIAELLENVDGGFAVGDVGFGFDTGLVALVVGVGRDAFVSNGAAVAVVADAQELATVAEGSIGRVVERVLLEGAWSFEREAEGFDRSQEGAKVGDGELELDLGALHGASIRDAQAKAGRRYDKSVYTFRLNGIEPDDVKRAAELLRAGGTVAFPTETVYGLGANATDAAAVARIFAAKRRPAWDPLIVHVASAEQVGDVAVVTGWLAEKVHALAKAFWPGPLTLLLPRGGRVPEAVTAGRPLVGVRVPAHPVALELLRQAGVPVAAPSANVFGHTSPTRAEHVLADLDGQIDAVLNGGATDVGVESTVFDPAAMMIYRPGAVTAEGIQRVLGERPQMYVAPERVAEMAALPSPGVGIRHYAPRARVVLVGGTEQAVAEGLRRADGSRVGVMLPEGWRVPEAAARFAWGRWDDAASLAAGLFAGLRTLDAEGVDVIVCPMPEDEGIGRAVRDRLLKAAKDE